MKALSIRQPWVWAILHAGKRIENRDWAGCAYRGPLLLHASQTCRRYDYEEAAYWMNQHSLAAWPHARDGLPSVPASNELSRGGIVGVCNVVDVIKPGDQRHPLIASAWYAGSLGLVLADVRPLPFMPYKGALGFFEVPDNLVPGARL